MPARVSLRPVFRAGDGAVPGGLEFFHRGAGGGGAEAAILGPLGGDLGAVFPKTHGEPGEVGGAERGRLGDARADDRHAEEIGLELHERTVDGGAAVDAELAEFEFRIGLHGGEQIGALVGDAFEGGAGEVGGGGAARKTDNRAAGGGVPVRRAEASEGRNEKDSAVIRDARGEGFDVGGGGDETKTVAEPLDDGAADEDATLERVFERGVGAEAPRDGGKELVF